MSFKTESCSTKSVWSQLPTSASPAVLVSHCLKKYNCIFEPVVKLHISHWIPAFELQEDHKAFSHTHILTKICSGSFAYPRVMKPCPEGKNFRTAHSIGKEGVGNSATQRGFAFRKKVVL